LLVLFSPRKATEKRSVFNAREENGTKTRARCVSASLRENRPLTENEIGTLILAAAIDVHRELGPGLLESVYEVVLAKELTLR
jgi:hypothetical protein